MEIGLGFVVGAVAGAVVAIIVAVVVGASRRAVAGKNSVRRDATPPAPSIPAAPAADRPSTSARSSARSPEKPAGRDTIIVEAMESRDRQLGKNVLEIRELLLRLADIVGSTENASGEAAQAFTSAKKIIHRVDSIQPSDLGEAQRILIQEIDRVLQSNAKLHSELDRANQGIVEQRRQIEELRLQARIDALTRIPNRAAFDERLIEYIGLLERSKLAFTLLLLDIDHFKLVNDAHGHINGDRILRGVAARITDSIRGNDFAARYVGEEFAVILPGTQLSEALMVAERVRQDIAKTNFRMDDQVVKMTVSGGLAQCVPGMKPDQIVAAADAALYQAKKDGRNRIAGGRGGTGVVEKSGA